jgi:hypothetical protein
VSSTSLILVRDSSPLRLVFLHDALRGGLYTDLTNLCLLFRQLRSSKRGGADQYQSGGY